VDAIGRKLYTTITEDTYLKINTAAYAKGIYFLIIKTGEDPVTFKLEFH